MFNPCQKQRDNLITFIKEAASKSNFLDKSELEEVIQTVLISLLPSLYSFEIALQTAPTCYPLVEDRNDESHMVSHVLAGERQLSEAILLEVIYDLVVRYLNETIKVRNKIKKPKSKIQRERCSVDLEINRLILYGRIFYYLSYILLINKKTIELQPNLRVYFRCLLTTIDTYFSLNCMQVLDHIEGINKLTSVNLPNINKTHPIVKSCQIKPNKDIRRFANYSPLEILREFGLITAARCVCYNVFK